MLDKYAVVGSQEENNDSPNSCDCCGVETIVKGYLTSFPSNLHARKKFKWLCLFCASTMAGVVHEWPEQYAPGTNTVLKSISQAMHVLLAQLKEKKV